MATPYKIVLGPEDVGSFHKGPYGPIVAAKVSEVLQCNLESWDILFAGHRHNHIVHCIFSTYGLGGAVDDIQKTYDREAAYQKPRYPVDENVVESMADKAEFMKYIDQNPHYSDFLLFFQREIEKKGVEKTLEEHLFAGFDYANGPPTLRSSGIFHPYLHLRYAFEFNQPAIVAEALAMAAVHDPEGEKAAAFFTKVEMLAGGPGQQGERGFHDIIEDMRQNKTLTNNIYGRGKINKAPDVADGAPGIVKYLSQYSIPDAQLEEELDEMIDTSSLFMATKPSPIKKEDPQKIDFGLLHCVNTLVLMPTLVNHKWISRENGVRLIEWAGRCHVLTCVGQTAPPITTAEIDKYSPKLSWDEVFDRAINHPTDDGHLQKCIRSLAFGEKVMSPKYGKGKFLMKPDAWLKLGNLAVDVVSYEAKTSEERWLLKL